MNRANGLSEPRPRTCRQCGTVFTAKTAKATYCSVDCARAGNRFGRHYGQYEPRQLGITKG